MSVVIARTVQHPMNDTSIVSIGPFAFNLLFMMVPYVGGKMNLPQSLFGLWDQGSCIINDLFHSSFKPSGLNSEHFTVVQIHGILEFINMDVF